MLTQVLDRVKYQLLTQTAKVYSNTGGQASKSTPLGASAKFTIGGKKTSKKSKKKEIKN